MDYVVIFNNKADKLKPWFENLLGEPSVKNTPLSVLLQDNNTGRNAKGKKGFSDSEMEPLSRTMRTNTYNKIINPMGKKTQKQTASTSQRDAVPSAEIKSSPANGNTTSMHCASPFTTYLTI